MQVGCLLRTVVIVWMIAVSGSLFGQGYHVKQVITGNSGKFEFAPPFQDYVTIQSYDPVTGQAPEFGTIFTQSVQDIFISGRYAWVTAQDSIVKYDLQTLERVAAVADSGVNKLAICAGRLVISKQYPLTRYFVTVRDTSDLSLVENIDGISGDCLGIVCTNDSVYVAVNGGWAGTEGKLAVIDPTNWSLIREVNLGPQAVGIGLLYRAGDGIISVNKTPYGTTPPVGSITVYNPVSSAFQNHPFDVMMGHGVGLFDNALYTIMNEGIGRIDLSSMTITDTAVIADPGSAVFTYITSATIDTLNRRFYVNTGDYITPGTCLVASLTGDSLTSYSTGISAEAIAVDYRENSTGTPEPASGGTEWNCLIFPNPVGNTLHIRSYDDHSVTGFSLYNSAGQLLLSRNLAGSRQKLVEVDVTSLPAGIYFITILSEHGQIIRRMVK